jgi:hypothetical protein
MPSAKKSGAIISLGKDVFLQQENAWMYFPLAGAIVDGGYIANAEAGIENFYIFI